MAGEAIRAGTRILVVEDEPALCHLLENAVTECEGLLIGPAGDIDTALQLIEEETIDVAILDLIIGGTYTYALADALMRKNIPFAFTTGLGPDRIDPRYAQVPTITKPFRTSYVVEVVGAIAGR